MPSYPRALHALRTWLDSWPGIGHVAVGIRHRLPWSGSPGLRGVAAVADGRGISALSWTAGV